MSERLVSRLGLLVRAALTILDRAFEVGVAGESKSRFVRSEALWGRLKGER